MTKQQDDLRKLRQQAMAGDVRAAKALLKMYGYGVVALEIKQGRPFTNKVRKAIDMLTAGTGKTDEPAYWEYREADGSTTNDLQNDPPPRGKARMRDALLDD
jgi:hypothetical protein